MKTEVELDMEPRALSGRGSAYLGLSCFSSARVGIYQQNNVRTAQDCAVSAACMLTLMHKICPDQVNVFPIPVVPSSFHQPVSKCMCPCIYGHPCSTPT